MSELTLPAFELDCRDWLVVSPAEAGLPEDVDGAPLLAVLSTVVIDEDVAEATGALTVGIVEDEQELTLRDIAPDAVARTLVDPHGDTDADPEVRRYVMQAPGHRLALLAEFVVPPDDHELGERVHRLMASFRWQRAA